MAASRSYVRPPAVAGRFYPDDPTQLRREVEERIGAAKATPTRAFGAVAPHAGYVYSGGVAGATFARLEVPRRVVVLAPNHTGRGERVAVATASAFAVPGAEVPVDEELVQAVLSEVAGASADQRAHEREHAVEVQLPFLVARRGDVRIAPVVLAGLDREEAVAAGEALARVVRTCGGPDEVLVVASSDMSHYLPDEECRRIDRLAIDRMLALDAAGLYQTVVEEDISMCGFIPATILCACARALGATRSELCAYATSGDAFGQTDSVVGYAGVVIPVTM